MKYAVLALVLAGSVHAGEAAIRDEFTIDASFEKVTAWIDAHAAEMREAVNVQLLEQDGDVYKLRRSNNRGTWVWRQRERVERRPAEWRLRSALVDCLEGGLHKLDGHVVIVPDGPGVTRVTAESAADVDGIKSRQVEYDLQTRARRLRKLLEESVE